jgi:hypothetical protein
MFVACLLRAQELKPFTMDAELLFSITLSLVL